MDLSRARLLLRRNAALLALVLGLGLSAAAAGWLNRQQASHEHAGFELRVDEAARAFERRLQSPLVPLRSVAGVYQATRQLDDKQFRDVVQSLELEAADTGVLGIGYVVRVPRNGVAEYESARLQDGAKGFALRTLGPGAHPVLNVVQLIEPLPRFIGTLGLDLASDPLLRSELQRVADTGMPRLVPAPAGALAGLDRTGLLLLKPVYLAGAPVQTPAERQAALIGWLFAAVDARQLLAGVFSGVRERLGAELVARPRSAAADLWSAQAPPGAALRPPGIVAHRQLAVLGLDIDIAASSTPAFDASLSEAVPWLMFVAGALASVLVAALLHHASAQRRAARLQASEMTAELDRLALVVRQTSNGVLIVGADGRISWVNLGFERTSGYSLAEVVGHRPEALLHFEGTDANVAGRLRHAVRAGEGFRGELLYRSKSGRPYWVDLELRPLHDSSGAPAGYMAIASDVTERRQAEHAFWANQVLLDQTGRIGGVGGFSVQFDTLEVQWTAQTCRLLGVDVEHRPTLQDCFEFCAPEGRVSVLRFLEEGASEGFSWEVELPMITAQGRAVWVRVVAELEFNDQGPMRLVGALQDITARRAMEAEVQRSAQLLRGAFETIDEAFVLYDSDDRLVFCNDKYRQVYTASAEVIQPGQRFEDIVRFGAERGQYPAAVGRVEEWVAQRVAEHRRGDSSLIQRISDGRTIRILERRMPDGHVVGFRFDITDLMRAKDAAESANRAKSEFIGTISHELRTPLQAIIGFSELGRHFAREHPRFEAMFADIHAGGRRMLTLVNGLLDVSKIDGTQGSMNLRRTALAPLVASVVAELKTLAAQRRLFVTLPEPGNKLHAEIDEFRIQQVLRNVLANAIRFSPEGGGIEIGLTAVPGDGVELTIRDHGPGIPDEELDAIFEPFVQSSRTRDGAGGTGLGLTICRRIMGAHCGAIRAANAPGGGALITLHLPADASAAESQPEAAPGERQDLALPA